MRWIVVVFAVLMTTFAGVGFAQTIETLDEPEQMAMSDTLQYALENNPSNEVSNWVNPDTGRSGAVVPIKTFTNEAGLPCREFITTIIIGGKEEQGYGTACRQPDGSWQIVTDEQDAVDSPTPSNVYVNAPLGRYVYVYPEMYYNYPSSFYYPYNIFLSFSFVYRSGHVHYGAYYLDGPSFHHRYPVHVRSRSYLGARIFSHHRWFYRPPVHYRHAVRPPVNRYRYDYRNRDVSRPVYRQHQILDRQNKVRQQQRRQPVTNIERQRKTLGNQELVRPRQHRQPATNVERQHKVLRNQERSFQQQRRQPATNIERQRKTLGNQELGRQRQHRQPVTNVERQRQNPPNQNRSQVQPQQQRKSQANFERTPPKTYQRSPFATQAGERR